MAHDKKDAQAVPQLHEKEQIDQQYGPGAVNNLGGRFDDMIQVKPDRVIYQYFTVGDSTVPLAIGFDKSGSIIETDNVKVTLSTQVPGGIQYEPYSGP